MTADRAASSVSRRHFLAASGAASLAAAAGGCWGGAQGGEVVVYAALDREFSEPILERFTQHSGIAVAAKYDVESTKTVGLVNAILQERAAPRCDVFWNNEIMHTLRLVREGALEPYPSPAAATFPTAYQADDGAWHGLAARGRVLLVNRELLPDAAAWPRSVAALAEPQWQGRCGLAKPLFGTTATHAAVWCAEWGEEATLERLAAMRDNAQIMAGNKQAAIAVARGQLAFCLTDTDDALVEIEAGHPVAVVYPDQDPGAPGALFIPNTVAIVRGGPNPSAARKLIDFLLSPEVELRLAAGPSGQFPLNRLVEMPPRVAPARPVKWQEVDFAAAAAAWENVAPRLREMFGA